MRGSVPRARAAPLTVAVQSAKDPGQPLQSELSIGAATITGHDGQHSAEDVLAEADRSMYGAKRNKAAVPPAPSPHGELR